MALMELRFHVPTDAAAVDVDEVEEFYKNVMKQADIIQATGESITVLPEVPCLVPRGRYDIKIYPAFLQLHGKTYDYKIPYTTILRFFLLPHRDGRQMYFVISLDPPIKQGNTRYPFLVFAFSKDVESTVELSLSEEVLKEKYDNKLEKEMTGPEYEIISRIMKTLVNRKITVPGSYVGHNHCQSIACSYKNNTGFLFPLERGFMFMHKPPIHLRFDEVSSVNFARGSGSTRSFDFDVETKNGIVFNFFGMEKDEFTKLHDFVKQKKLRVKNTGDSFRSGGGVDDFNSDDDDEGGHDAYLVKMKREGRDKEPSGSSNESSEDEDFVAPVSGSEIGEEFDTDFTTSGSEAEGGVEGAPKKKKERKTITIQEPGMRKKKKREKGEKGEKSEKRGKKGKQPKDPNAPKRPLTAYFLWMNSNRERINSENPGLSVSEFAKKAGEIWRGLGDSDKVPWEEKNQQAKEEYEEKMRTYKPDMTRQDSSDPLAAAAKVKGGTGMNFKSKEFISDSESEVISDSDSDEKPLKPKSDKKKVKRKTKKREKAASNAGSASDEETTDKSSPAVKRERKEESGSSASESGSD